VTALRVKAPSERDLRLGAGLVMFTYATCHFISHATGLFRLAGIEAIGHDIVLAPWRTPAGRSSGPAAERCAPARARWSASSR